MTDETQVLTTEKLRKCCHCKESKPLTEFYRNSCYSIYKWSDPSIVLEQGYEYYCKICRSMLRKIRRNENIQAERTKAREYYHNNKDKVLAWNKKYAQKNPQIIAVFHQNYRSRKLNNGGTITLEETNKLIQDSNNKCFWCGCDIPKGKLQLDHIYPVSKGGKNNIGNIAVSCKMCNCRKKDKEPDEFMEELSKEHGNKL